MLTPNHPLTRKTIGLFALSIASALLWYLEVICHGWDGLKWISYFHWALPIGVGSFVLWALWAGPFQDTKQRIKFVVLAFVLAPVFYVISQNALHLMFGGPSAFLLWLSLMCWLPEALVNLFVTIPWSLQATLVSWGVLIPIMLAQSLRLVGMRIRMRTQLIATLLFCSDYPVGLMLLWCFGAKQIDTIHTIKSGTAIPMMVIGLGSLFLLPQRPTKDSKTP